MQCVQRFRKLNVSIVVIQIFYWNGYAHSYHEERLSRRNFPDIGENFFKMSCSTCVLRLGIALLVVGAASAQTPAPPPDPAPSSTPTWSAGPIDFSGLVDGYYSLNFNHPASRTIRWRNFDAKANQFSLNMAKLTMEHTADPIGFKFELAAGRGWRFSMRRNRRASRYISMFCRPM